MTGKEISVKEVYEATGVPSDSEIEEILHHLLNYDCKTASQFITELCEQKVLKFLGLESSIRSDEGTRTDRHCGRSGIEADGKEGLA